MRSTPVLQNSITPARNASRSDAGGPPGRIRGRDNDEDEYEAPSDHEALVAVAVRGPGGDGVTVVRRLLTRLGRR